MIKALSHHSAKRHLEEIGGRLKKIAAIVAGNRRSVCLPVPSLIQVDGHSCGFCSALMVTNFYSVRISQERLRRFACISRDGTSTRQMVQFLRGGGLSVRVHEDGEAHVATVLQALDKDIPVIVSVRPKHPHYLVITGYDSRFLYVNDPAAHRNVFGRIRRRRFRRIWTREALIVTRRTRLCRGKRDQHR
jgi:ABC-type bacteriocin/lantibiotic exporter with double-glycine peptidase domain